MQREERAREDVWAEVQGCWASVGWRRVRMRIKRGRGVVEGGIFSLARGWTAPGRGRRRPRNEDEDGLGERRRLLRR